MTCKCCSVPWDFFEWIGSGAVASLPPGEGVFVGKIGCYLDQGMGIPKKSHGSSICPGSCWPTVARAFESPGVGM